MLVSIQEVRLKSDLMIICLAALLSSTVRAIQHMYTCAQHVWMYTCIPTCKSERLTWDGCTTEKVVSFRALEACVRIRGCWHLSPGLIVAAEGVSLHGAWHGRERASEGGRAAGLGDTEEPVCCCHNGWHGRRAVHRWALPYPVMRRSIYKQQRQG